jgi:hypothetical protein
MPNSFIVNAAVLASFLKQTQLERRPRSASGWTARRYRSFKPS